MKFLYLSSNALKANNSGLRPGPGTLPIDPIELEKGHLRNKISFVNNEQNELPGIATFPIENEGTMQRVIL